MWPASQSWVIDLRKTSLKSPLLFSGWQNCYVFTYQPNLPSNRIRTDHLCWWIPACLRLERKWLEPSKWSSLGFPVTLGPGSRILAARAEPLLQGPGHTGDGVQWDLALAQLFRGLSVHRSRFMTGTKLTKGISFTYPARWSSWSPESLISALTEVAFLCEYFICFLETVSQLPFTDIIS